MYSLWPTDGYNQRLIHRQARMCFPGQLNVFMFCQHVAPTRRGYMLICIADIGRFISKHVQSVAEP